MRLLGDDAQDRRPLLVDGAPAGFTAHEGDHGRLVHEPQFPLRPVLGRVRVVDDGRVQEQPAVGQDAVEIPGQGAEVSEGVFLLFFRDPVPNRPANVSRFAELKDSSQVFGFSGRTIRVGLT